MTSYSSNNGLLKQGEHRSVYANFGMLRQFCRRKSASWASSCWSRSLNRFRSSNFLEITMSILWLPPIGAPSSWAEDGWMWVIPGAINLSRTAESSVMSSHFCSLILKPSDWLSWSIVSKSEIKSSILPGASFGGLEGRRPQGKRKKREKKKRKEKKRKEKKEKKEKGTLNNNILDNI